MKVPFTSFTRLPSIIAVGVLVLASCAPATVPAPAPAPAAPAQPAPAAPAAPAPALATPTPVISAPRLPQPAAPAPAASPTSVPAARGPVKGGTLRMHMGRGGRSLDPHVDQSLTSAAFYLPIYSNLVEVDPQKTTEVIPALAEKWEIKGEKLWVFNLRKGVKFHDGKEFTAADVIFSYDRLQNPPKGAQGLSAGHLKIAKIAKVTAPDPYTVHIETSAPSPTMLGILSNGWVPIVPKHVVEGGGDLNKKPVGSGPYQFVRYTPDVGGRLERNPTFFRAGLPYMDALDFVVIPDPKTATVAFRAGKLDIMRERISPEEFDPIQKAIPGVHGQQVPRFLGPGIWLKPSRKPFTDIRVRRAVDLAIDRQELIALQSPLVKPNLGSPLQGTIWALPQDELSKRPGFRQPKDADIAEAKKLLAGAGYPNGFKLTTYVGQQTAQGWAAGPDDEALIISRQLKKIGVDLEVKVIEYARQQKIIWIDKDFEFASIWGSTAVEDPDALYAYFYKGGARNYGELDVPEFNDLLEKQSVTLDTAKRKELVYQLQRAVLDYHATPYLYAQVIINGVAHPWVVGYNADFELARYNLGRFDTVWIDPTKKR